MTSPYLDRPLVPLAVALPRLLENIEAELANEKLESDEERRLCRRAELVRSLLAPSRVIVCSRCGSRNVDMVVTGTERR